MLFLPCMTRDMLIYTEALAKVELTRSHISLEYPIAPSQIVQHTSSGMAHLIKETSPRVSFSSNTWCTAPYTRASFSHPTPVRIMSSSGAALSVTRRYISEPHQGPKDLGT